MASKIANCLMGVGYTEKEVKELFTENPGLEYDKIQAMKFLSQREKNLLRAKRNAQIQALSIDRAERQVDAFLEAYPGNHKEALRALMTKSGTDLNVSTTEGRYHAIKDQAYANLTPYMEQHKGTWGRLLVADKQFGKDVLKEMHGKGTGNALAAKASRDLSTIFEQLRTRYNRAGGNIGKLSDWNAVQSHDALRVSKVDPQVWVDSIAARLDLDRMGLKDADDIQRTLLAMHEDIKTGGLGRLEPGSVPMDAKSALANRVGARHRALHFKSVDDFLSYQEEFGSRDLFASMMAHIDTMSKDIAVMETFGPNPNATFKYLKDRAMKQSGDQNVADSAENIFKDMMGETMAKNQVAADRMGSLRALTAAGKLKFATLSALSDTAFMGLESLFAGVPVMKTYARFLSQMWSDGDKRLAARVAGVAEYALDTLAQVQRYTDITAGSGFMNKAAALTVRGSGLEAWTNAAKRAFALEFSAELGNNVGKTLDSMSPGIKRTLGIYGITDADWRALGKAKYTHKGTTYLDLSQIADPELAVKYSTMMRGEMKYAVPEPGWREQAFMKQGTQSGTLPGEIMRTGMQFKSYPITLMMTWWSRILRSQAMEGKLTRTGYAGALIASTTMLGVVSTSAKDVFKGKTPPPLDDSKTYWRGFMQGGSAGPVMDYLSESAGGRSVEFFAGPLGSEAAKLSKIVASNTNRVLKGEDTHVSHALLNQMRGMTPGGWQMALGMRRTLFDQLNKVVDEDMFRENARRAKTRARKEGQDITWKPGELTPEIMK